MAFPHDDYDGRGQYHGEKEGTTNSSGRTYKLPATSRIANPGTFTVKPTGRYQGTEGAEDEVDEMLRQRGICRTCG